MKKIDAYLEEAIINIQNDRKITKDLLMDVVKYIKVDEDRHRDVGAIAAKYVETLQRSNEQLVKIAALLHKKNNTQNGLTEEDKSELFDLIKEAN